jgi:nucleoside phosphorylase
MAEDSSQDRRGCTLLLFVATSTEEDALRQATVARGLPFEKVKDDVLRRFGWHEYHWIGPVGSESVIAVRPTRERGQVVMGALGRLGVAAKAIRFQEATGALGIVQLGMAFGIAGPPRQNLGDVLVSAALIPYDNRDIKPHPSEQGRYVTDYSSVSRELARPSLVDLFRREKARGGHGFGVHIGAVLSGAARIHCRAFRDEVAGSVPGGEDPIVGGEMEGVGLLAASAVDDPIWCVVKSISDFADENRDRDIAVGRESACRNAADFVLSALMNDPEGR